VTTYAEPTQAPATTYVQPTTPSTYQQDCYSGPAPTCTIPAPPASLSSPYVSNP
jgi:hypothetical protein